MRFTITTTAQAERDYEVEAASEEEARSRLRIHLKDPGVLRDGLVEKRPDVRNSTPERIKHAERVESGRVTVGVTG